MPPSAALDDADTVGVSANYPISHLDLIDKNDENSSSDDSASENDRVRGVPVAAAPPAAIARSTHS